jgi:putative DNA primase/helicase
VIDIDIRHGGNASWQALLEEHGLHLEATLTAQTGGGGMHLFYRAPETTAIRSTAGHIGPGIDVKAAGGYIVAPPSRHRSGQPYSWILERYGEPVQLPPPLLLLLRRPTAATRSVSDEAIVIGRRNTTLFSMAGSMRRAGMSHQAVLAAIEQENQRCSPPLEQAELEEIAQGILRYPGAPTFQSPLSTPASPENGSVVPEEGFVPSRFHHTDMGNAERLIARHGVDLRYCYRWRKWLVWNGTRWATDDGDAAVERGKETIRSIYTEISALPEEDMRAALAKHAARSEGATRIKDMLYLAQSALPITSDELDTEPWLFNCRNGVIDLRTGELLPHRRETLITKASPISYCPEAKAPRWQAFLQRVMDGREHLITFLQRAAGYTLTGETGEDVLFFLYGTGRNGKSKYLSAIEHVMGSYGQPTRPETIMIKDHGDVPNDVAALAGARFVPTIEVEDGRRLAETLVKQLTGGDTISARFLHAEYFSFRPTFKIWLAANHLPVIRGTDRAIWSRILTIPFAVTIPEAEQDPYLSQKLRQEADGILAWMVEGCLAWQRGGLQPPAEVLGATENYRVRMDVLAAFLEEQCTVQRSATVQAKALYESYKAWCLESSEHPWSMRRINHALEERGLARERSSDGSQRWYGIGLRAD